MGVSGIGLSMNIETLDVIVEKLQASTVGKPEWVPEKNVFEYSDESIEVVVVLKLVRATHGVHSMNLLCQSGLFVDMCTLWRCVNDCVAEVFFLLEKYPQQSNNVQKFIREFFSNSIDNFLSTEEEPVQNKKIISAYARVLSESEQDEVVRQTISRIHRTNSGYIHASYCHIMEMFGGPGKSFNLTGISSQEQKQIRMEIVEAAATSVFQTIAFAAQRFNLHDLYEDIKKYR